MVRKLQRGVPRAESVLKSSVATHSLRVRRRFGGGVFRRGRMYTQQSVQCSYCCCAALRDDI